MAAIAVCLFLPMRLKRTTSFWHSNHIHYGLHGKIFRDSEGRIRTETEAPVFTLDSKPFVHINITDLVEGRIIFLDTEHKIATVTHLGQPVSRTATGIMLPAGNYSAPSSTFSLSPMWEWLGATASTPLGTAASTLFKSSITGSCGFTIFKVRAADQPASVENSESSTTAEMWLPRHTATASSGVETASTS